MQKNKTFHRNKIVAFFFGCVVLMCMLMVRLGYLMVFGILYGKSAAIT